jgi:hypothetical protein
MGAKVEGWPQMDDIHPAAMTSGKKKFGERRQRK